MLLCLIVFSGDSKSLLFCSRNISQHIGDRIIRTKSWISKIIMFFVNDEYIIDNRPDVNKIRTNSFSWHRP